MCKRPCDDCHQFVALTSADDITLLHPSSAGEAVREEPLSLVIGGDARMLSATFSASFS